MCVRISLDQDTDYVTSGNRSNRPEAEVDYLRKLVADSGVRADCLLHAWRSLRPRQTTEADLRPPKLAQGDLTRFLKIQLPYRFDLCHAPLLSLSNRYSLES